MPDDVVEVLGVGPGGPCAGLLESLRTPDGAWLHPTTQPHIPGVTGESVTTAIIDTGLSVEHPRLRRAVTARVDLTAEGEGDECGHGTVVALILLAWTPDAKLIDVKALGRGAKATAERLVEALDWVRHRQDARFVNLSAGLYRPWCTGECDVCQAATRLAESGHYLTVAAGNRPGITACPAKARGDRILSVGELDPLLGALTATTSPTGPNGILAPTGPYRMEVSEP